MLDPALNVLTSIFESILLLNLKHPYKKVYQPSEHGDETNDEHLMWMIQEIRENFEQSNLDKHRWIGFIQGVLLVKGYSTLDLERLAAEYMLIGYDGK